MRLRFQPQHDIMDCGPACLSMIAKYYGKTYTIEVLREKCFLSRNGVSMLSLNDAATEIGFRTMAAKISFVQLANECPCPCILHWNQDHFVVLKNIKKKRRTDRGGRRYNINIVDPAHGIVTIDEETFLKNWITTTNEKGTVLVLEPTPDFYNSSDTGKKKKEGYGFLFKYLVPHRRYVIQLILGMVTTSIISLAFPFLTQLLVDYGIRDADINIVYFILLSQLFLFIGTVSIDMIQAWLMLHVNTRISLNIISDFLSKLLKLPIRFFDTKAVGDISQRINDHHRIEAFLTANTLNFVFSFINIVVFTIVLGFYNISILVVFSTFSVAAVSWIFLFQKRRKHLDYRRFSRNKENQDKLFEIINGMQEIKLYGSETPMRWQWERLQVKLFKLNMKSLALEQYQRAGFVFLSQLKNIIISCVAAIEVIKGHSTLGILLSISYIIGQTNSPLEQFVTFIKAAQDARLSMNRMQEIHNKENEEVIHNSADELVQLPVDGNIELRNVSFQYEGPRSPFILKNISLTIPEGKVTAIVGASGSGKTTLMKLLLNFYAPVSGSIHIGKLDIKNISPKRWRNLCGTVMQDGYIFSDSITKNIALDGNEVDKNKMKSAAHIAHLEEFINGLPLGFTTKIGNNGVGISGGQKQRLLIARSVYKNPAYLFFDEATSSLDANSEKVIMENLNKFFRNKTVVIIAHRLSTVKNADNIIVLDKGEIVEMGRHEELTYQKGYYFTLVKNQLELGE